jgi:GH18 family chitinase
MFTAEASSSGKAKLLITAATAPDGRMSALDLPALNRLMDFMMPMTYDIHGSWYCYINYLKIIL